ncbi:hypothetical protein Cgig2_002022 [Carnegiea gigantea]|uniref:Uncharacterized protein n=1 Tax=Carnegiea gigantea TaxID=171969 RepID=A0A9Q1GKH5_9CARY|nr:hypothetical protein Cgig2_002022 [Carnegiea gigantea]
MPKVFLQQEDIKVFLQQEQAGTGGFLETKVKEPNIQQVMSKICANWQWEHNATMTERGRIILNWHPRRYNFSPILKTDQLLHGELNKNKFVDIYKQQTIARNDLLKAQAQLQQDPTNQELIFEEVSCRDLYISINHSAMLLIKQQCKAEWISCGDECIRVFMAKIKQRRACTSIYYIKDQHEKRVEGFEAVSKFMTNYYKKLLGENDHHRTHIDIQVINMGECLNLEQQMQLCKPFTDADIKKVLFSIPTYKSPGPYGYNSGFYKACWEDIGPLVCSVIKEIFSGGTFLIFMDKQS